MAALNGRTTVTAAVTVKKALLVALVVLLVLVGMPALMPGMGGAMCHDCGSAVSAGQACTALLVSVFALAIALMGVRLRTRCDRYGDLLRSLELYRPPQMT